MMNRKSINILIAMVLAAAICSALGSEAHAAWNTRGFTSATHVSNAPRHTLGPFAGEPEAGGTSAPLPPKTGSTRPAGS
jgi:hypothetical protein